MTFTYDYMHVEIKIGTTEENIDTIIVECI